MRRGWLVIVCLTTGRVHGGELAEGSFHTWVYLKSLCRYYEQPLIDTGQHPGVTREGHEEVKRFKRENAESRRASETLGLASTFFIRELDQSEVR